MTDLIYKICVSDEWEQAQKNGVYTGSSDDIRDGFMHFSTDEQLEGTLQKHFKGIKDLFILSVSVERLDSDKLKWEISRNNKKFPHLYGDLDLNAVIEVKKV